MNSFIADFNISVTDGQSDGWDEVGGGKKPNQRHWANAEGTLEKPPNSHNII